MCRRKSRPLLPVNFTSWEDEDGTGFNPDVGPPATLPRDLPGAGRRLVQWLVARLPDLRDRFHRSLYLSGKPAKLARVGAPDRARHLPGRQLLRMVDPSLRDAPP